MTDCHVGVNSKTNVRLIGHSVVSRGKWMTVNNILFFKSKQNKGISGKHVFHKSVSEYSQHAGVLPVRLRRNVLGGVRPEMCSPPEGVNQQQAEH